MTTDDKAIAANIEEIRKSRRIPQKALYDKLDISRATYAALIKGERHLISPYLELIAEELGVSMEVLLFGHKLYTQESEHELNDAVEHYRTNMDSLETQLADAQKELKNQTDKCEILSARVKDLETIISFLNSKLAEQSQKEE